MKCANCARANENNGLKVDVNHEITDNKCMVYKRRVELQKRNFLSVMREQQLLYLQESFKIIYFNCQGLLNKKREIELYVQREKPSIVCLTQTHLKAEVLANELEILRYRMELGEHRFI